MLQFESQRKDVFDQFMKGNFTAQITESHSFNRMEPDKIIEVTLNKESKAAGGTAGFSRNQGAMNRCKLNIAYSGGHRSCLQEFLDYHPRKYKRPNLNSCISNGALVPIKISRTS